MNKILRSLLSIVLFGFGILSTFLTISIIFDLFGIREKEGNYVLFIVYANLICGLIYIISAVKNWKGQKSATAFLAGATFILFLAFIALQVYVSQGGVHEEKTLSAMVFRIGLTAVMTAVSYYLNRKSINTKN